MKNNFLIIISIVFSITTNYAADWTDAKWIWEQEDGVANSWVSFRKTVNIDNVPGAVMAHIAVDSKFWLWINGELVVFEGGVSRGPSQAGVWDRENDITPSNSWYEAVDIKPYLKPGENTIALLVWYWGRETHKGSHIDSGKGGLLFHCELGGEKIVSDATWKVKKHPGYSENSGENGTSIVQYNVKYNAQNDLNDWSPSAWYTSGYNDTSWSAATDKGAVPAAPWYDLEENYVPRLINHGLKNYENNTALNFPFVSDGTDIICKLPFNKQITPYFEIESAAGEIIEIDTDNRLNKITAHYTTKSGDQAFECFSWMNGQSVIYKIPAGVTVKALKYRWMSVGEMVGSFEASDPFYERLWWMGRNTLFVCARDNFMDCPDRERALWIGDAADQTGYLFYSMDNAGRQLLKKAIYTTFNFSENKVIGALGPRRVRELPSQSLQFIAQLVWPYYYNTGDTETLQAVYAQVYDYLALWDMDTNGLPKYRKWASPDNWDWTDWGVPDTIDKTPIQFALYYMALDAAKKMAEELGETAQVTWYENRMNSIKSAYDQEYWKNGFYSSNVSKFKDDRLNALAILSGLADSSKFEDIVDHVLVPNKFSSPHFEWMVEAAMCEAGKHNESLDRMKAQYQSQVNTVGQSTLYEMFPKGGSYNHAWNASNTVLSKYIAGIEPTKVGWSEYKVCPNLVHLTSFKHLVPTVNGDIQVDVNTTNDSYKLDLISPEGTTAIVGIPKKGFDIVEVKVGNQTVWKNGSFVGGVSGISWQGEDDGFVMFKAASGTWNFLAEGVSASTIPGTIEVENFNVGGQGVAYSDVDPEDVLGHGRSGEGVDIGLYQTTKYLGSTSEGEWIEYSVIVDEYGIYDLDFVYASQVTTGVVGLEFFFENNILFEDFALPQTSTINDTTFETQTKSGITLTRGTHVLRINVKKGGFNLDKIQFRFVPTQFPYNNVVRQIPGKIEAEDYDLGGEGIAYHDSDDVNQVGDYRADGVDIGTGGTGYTLGYLSNGEWLEYTIDVTDTGYYDLNVNYSSGKPTPGASLGIELFDEEIMLVNNFAMPNSGGWSTYTPIFLGNFLLTKGEHVIRFNIIKTGFNLDWMEFTLTSLLGTGDFLANKTLKVHPMPSENGRFHLSKTCAWEVYSLLGVKISGAESNSVDISKVAKGMYFLKTKYGTKRLLFK